MPRYCCFTSKFTHAPGLSVISGGPDGPDLRWRGMITGLDRERTLAVFHQNNNKSCESLRPIRYQNVRREHETEN